MTNKLHTMLGSMEDKVHQAKSQGTAHNVDRNLLTLSHKYAPSGMYQLCLFRREKKPVGSNFTSWFLK